jgi:hypothetical protein
LSLGRGDGVFLDWDDGFDAGGEPLGERPVVESESDAQQRGELRDGFGELAPGWSNRLHARVDLEG